MATTVSPESEFLLYQTEDGRTRVEVRFEGETVWLSLAQMAELFQRDKSVISRHIKNVFEEGELVRESVVAESATTASDGKTYRVEYFNLDVIISVGYRVKSQRGTQFRIWATQTLREFLIKGFVLDDERLKLNKRFGKDYFDELRERIREIRASERRFYLKITDIYEQCSIDYDKNAEITQTFFKSVLNKLHWAVTGKTAAELIAERANASKPAMGMTSWKNAPTGKILKSNANVAKNYLTAREVKELERVVSMYLDYAENQAARQIPVRMADWVNKLDAFLQFNEYEVLTNGRQVSAEVAKQLAEEQYAKFRVQQDHAFESDFEKEVKRIQ